MEDVNDAGPWKEKTMDDKFLDELIEVLKDVPWHIWKRYCDADSPDLEEINDVQVVKLSSSSCFVGRLVDSVCVKVRHDGYCTIRMEGFDRIDHGAKLAALWEPYHLFMKRWYDNFEAEVSSYDTHTLDQQRLDK